MHRDILVRWLDEFLKSREITQQMRDPSLNGLQVEGNEQVHKVGAAVDAAQATIDKAREQGVDFMIVHHGLFWGGAMPVVGIHKRRLEALFQGGISLYASHLPLDVHPEVGNNAVIAQALGLQNLEPFEVGFIGSLFRPHTLSEIGDRLGQITGMQCLIHQGGPNEVTRVAVISGSASDYVAQAKAAGAELLITGEPKHQNFHPTFELGMNAIYAGHYDTETFGVKALAERIEREFGLPWVFLEHPTGL
ncbi:Nif3-like dinuclear metal center hexameric protein [Calidithermus timidus]|jgi:dinuclear metal center YbgI/SA1388 family protein|uniref:Nif3-like dinuclear metal center hexameric protein n=1 Tax=Calidithermus timidus TaxID=307124 RepID=UPI0003695667|nr:Nif3-like dinuclear metal center hexameric protein [Calidithermus timidus]